MFPGNRGEASQLRALAHFNEREQQALFRILPDLVFRLQVGPDGSVSVLDSNGRAYHPVDVAGQGAGVAGKETGSTLTEILSRELAARSQAIMSEYLRTGEIQHFEFRTDWDGHLLVFDVRSALFDKGRILAVARDVTARAEAESALAISARQLAEVNGIIQNEVAIQAANEKTVENSLARLEKLLEDTIELLAMIVHKKNPRTAAHQERVSRLACAIGREMRLDAARVDIVGLAALLHDLGMVLIPSHTTDKRGRLSRGEVSTMKTHAEAEYQVLKTIDLFIPIADVVYQHHERLDGSGYPRGLKGEEISLEARILAVADVVEAMLSDRPHRPAFSVEKALKEINAGKGISFDPDAVEACARVLARGKFDFDGLNSPRLPGGI